MPRSYVKDVAYLLGETCVDEYDSKVVYYTLDKETGEKTLLLEVPLDQITNHEILEWKTHEELTTEFS